MSLTNISNFYIQVTTFIKIYKYICQYQILKISSTFLSCLHSKSKLFTIYNSYCLVVYVTGYIVHYTAWIFRSLTGEKSRHWPNQNVADGKQVEIVYKSEKNRDVRKYKQELPSSGMWRRVVWREVRDFVKRCERLELISQWPSITSLKTWSSGRPKWESQTSQANKMCCGHHLTVNSARQDKIYTELDQWLELQNFFRGVYFRFGGEWFTPRMAVRMSRKHIKCYASNVETLSDLHTPLAHTQTRIYKLHNNNNNKNNINKELNPVHPASPLKARACIMDGIRMWKVSRVCAVLSTQRGA